MKMNVLYQFNDAYAPYAGVSMVSLFENNKDIEHLHIFVIADQLSQQNTDQLQKTALDYNRKISFLNPQNIIQQMKNLGIPQYRGAYTTNMKLFLPEILDLTDGRILYIDSDTLIVSSLKALATLDMHDHPIAMAYDSLGQTHARQIGHGLHDPYFNAGVILFDIKKWHQEKCTQRIIDHVKQIRAHYIAPDQDLLNVVLKNEIAVLPPEYNLQPIHARYTASLYPRALASQTYYSDAILSRAATAPVILHFFRFLGEFPWDVHSLHPYREIFEHYQAQSRWYDHPKTVPLQGGIIFRIERILYRILPDRLFLLIFRLGYEGFIRKCSADSKKGKNNRFM